MKCHKNIDINVFSHSTKMIQGHSTLCCHHTWEKHNLTAHVLDKKQKRKSPMSKYVVSLFLYDEFERFTDQFPQDFFVDVVEFFDI